MRTGIAQNMFNSQQPVVEQEAETVEQETE
jgi:hypothetical protein